MRPSSAILKPARWGITAFICLVALGACAREIGQPFDVDAVDRLKPGHSTYADAVKQFGVPNRRAIGHGSETIAHWHYLKDTPDGTDYDSLKIVFDQNGRMVRIVERLDSGEDEGES